MSKWTLRLAVVAASVTGALLLSSCAHRQQTAALVPVEKNYYHCVYKNKHSHKTFSANSGTMKGARQMARQECRAAGQHHKACRLSLCKYVH